MHKTPIHTAVPRPPSAQDLYGSSVVGAGAGAGTGLHAAALARALSMAANPILIVDRSSAVVWCNAAYGALVGQAAEALLKRKPASLAPSRDNARFLADLWSIVQSGQTWKGELAERHSDGTVIQVDAVLTPLEGSAGSPALFMLFLHDVTEHKKELDRAWAMANHDRLTGLPNRGFFASLFEHTLAQALRASSRCAVLYIDLDGFKGANDTHGHDIGDLVLIETAEILRSIVRKSDIVARLGGDEFVCVLDDVSTQHDAGEVASKIIKGLNLMDQVGGRKVAIGASVGIAMYPQDGLSREELTHAADTAMFEAKRAGRNRWCSASAGLTAATPGAPVPDDGSHEAAP